MGMHPAVPELQRRWASLPGLTRCCLGRARPLGPVFTQPVRLVGFGDLAC